jgi:hypothetical protein
VDGAYKTQTDFEQAIAAVYSQQQALYATGQDNWFRGTITRGDDTSGNPSGGLTDIYVYGVDVFTNNSINSWSLSAWQKYWRMISRCNLILDKIDAVEFANADLKNYIKGEAYILRAYAYNYLAIQYGGMPLIDKSMTSDEIKMITRSTKDETLTFAAEDYKKAITLLPAEWAAASKGRATKYAAEGMLARLYLFQSKFSAAKPLLNDIITSGKYTMEGDYVNCFTDSKDNGPERVWEVQFAGGLLNEGSQLPTLCLPEGFNDKTIMPFPGQSTAMPVSNDLFTAYEPGDKRKNLSVFFYKNVNYVIKYTHYDAYTPKSGLDWANNLPILRYTDVKMMYAEALNEEGYAANGEAFNILNSVRTRAGLPSLSATNLPDKVAFRNAIIKERRVEFAFEGLRWFDLIRWGIVVNTINQYLATPVRGNGFYSMKDYQMILPIPFEEISSYNDSKIMPQNPGY